MLSIQKVLDHNIDELSKNKIRLVRNFHDLRVKIDDIYKNACKTLENLQSENLGELESLEVMLNHKKRELIWMEYFIKFKIDHVEAGEYTQDFLTHQKLQARLYKELALPPERLKQIDAEFIVKGSITIENFKETILKEQERKRRENEKERR